MKLKLFLLTFALIFSGCANVKMNATEDYQLTKVPNAPEDFERLRVILTDFKDNHNAEYARDLGAQVQAQLRTILTQSSVELVNLDRGLRDQMAKEIELYEVNGTSEYTPPKAANLAVDGEINTVYVETKFEPEHKNMFGKKIKDQCVSIATAKGAITAYKVNPIARITAFVIDGEARENTTPTNKKCPEKNSDQKRIMVTQAIEEGLKDLQGKIQTVTAARGHVVSARIDREENKVYYRLSVLPRNGAKPGIRVEFLDYKEFENRLEEFSIAEGKVVCTDMPKYAFAEIKDPAANEEIKVGTIVKLKYDYFALFAGKGLPTGLGDCN